MSFSEFAQCNVSCQWKTIFDFYFVNTDINNTILLSRIKTTPRMYHYYSPNSLPPPMENRSTLFSGFPLENKSQKENVYNLPGPIKDHLLIDTSAVQCSSPEPQTEFSILLPKIEFNRLGKNIVMLANMLRLQIRPSSY